ncbi:hypothetical protein CLIB1444_23S00342 [[Candida] jaroonii]|uniref:Uncharacterized protein n=1 Tax=[Candida] jaroonii TaxID=467808 RepID=A0ACA9YG39_9ASCO|nr:hypothetical protein CLIB1444_23S00342 [[Candida] jaroonii]
MFNGKKIVTIPRLSPSPIDKGDEGQRMEGQKSEIHKHEVHKNEIHKHEVYKHEVHKHEVHKNEVHKPNIHKTNSNDFDFYKPNPFQLSPVKTPKGRAGLPSPKKRSIDNLNGSAVRRAINTRISTTLDDEDTFEDDELNHQDLEIAEAIIRESRETPGTSINHYGSLIPLEDDESDESPRKRRTTKRIKYQISDDEPMSDDEVVINESSEEEKDEVISDVESDDLSDPPVEIPKQRGRRPKVQEFSSPVKSPRKQVTSIFRRDDQTLFVENLSPQRKLHSESLQNESLQTHNPQTQKPQTQKPQNQKPQNQKPQNQKDTIINTLLNLGLLDTTKSSIVTGIEKIDENSTTKEKLELLPVPRSADGTVPQEYIDKYLGDIKWEARPVNEAADDRAYFIEGTEGYFDQMSNRDRHSVMSLSSLGISLTHEEFSTNISMLERFKKDEINQLVNFHKQNFNQWSFELSQNFNLCFFGVGSKIDLLNQYASEHLINWVQSFYKLGDDQLPKILVVNGYNPGIKLKEMFDGLVKELLAPEHRGHSGLTKPLSESLPLLVRLVNKYRGANVRDGDSDSEGDGARDGDTENGGKKAPVTATPKLILLVHCLDGEPLRDEKNQVHLSQLASLPEVLFISSVDNINFPLLWDSYKTENFRFLYHNLTTYKPLIVETSFKDALAYGKTRRTQSSRGAKFVLSALNENSKKMYKILLTLQLAKLKELNPKNTVKTSRGNLRTSVDFKGYHEKCTQEFITSNEINFRSMFNEFTEHNMSVLTKDEGGTEKVYIPYTGEEMERLLKDSFR